MFKNIAIIGASGAIGKSILKRLSGRQGVERIYAFSSSFDEKKSETWLCIILTIKTNLA